MRVGSNPEKFNKELHTEAYHRVIVPVYIPHFEGYFKQGFEIVKLTIESLLLTVHDKTRITIYNNNCAEEVTHYIEELYRNNPLVDQVFHSKENLGKINAILAGVKGNLEPIITITDADVFFKHDWQKEVEQLFLDFPSAGMISPVPGSRAYGLFTNNNWFLGLFKGRMRFEAVQDPAAMRQFDESLGDKIQLYSPAHLERYLVLQHKGKQAVMGCGHFVATLRREVFDKGSNAPSLKKIDGYVIKMKIDAPNENLGFLRLATLQNYAHHMGNVPEDWMYEAFKELSKRKANLSIDASLLLNAQPLHRWQTFLGRFFRKVLLSRFFKAWFFARLGLKNGAKY